MASFEFMKPVLIVTLLGTISAAASASEDQPTDEEPGIEVRSPEQVRNESDDKDFATNPDGAGGMAPAEDKWRVDFKTWIWLLGVDGDAGVDGIVTGVSADFGDILHGSDSLVGFSGRLDIGKGKWGGFIDGIYADLGINDVSSPGAPETELSFKMNMVDFGVMYRIGEWASDGAKAELNKRDVTLDLYAGLRYTSFDLHLNQAGAPPHNRYREWVDPIVGAKIDFPISKSMHIEANGDVGGFGLESDFTWSATAVIGWDFALFDHPSNIFLGYRAIGHDSSNGRGADKFTWDVITHGPIIGFSLLF